MRVLKPLLLGGLLLSTRGQAAGDDWDSYVNARYGFRVCYPAHLLTAQGEADNGDGQTFKAHDGAELKVFGANNALNRTLTQEAADQARYYTGRQGRITYRFVRSGWQVLSGDDGGGSLFYTKIFGRDGQFITFQIKYPKAQVARYKPVVERLSRCFQPFTHGM